MTLCGSIDHRCSAGATTTGRVQELWKMVFTFFERMVAAGNCTRVALQYGNGGTGTGWWDSGAPTGANAFAVYWFGSASKPFAVLLQYGLNTVGNYFGLAPGNPGAVGGLSGTSSGVGISVAARIDGTNPWNGTVLNNGADTKGTPVWSPGSSTLHVIQRSCAPGGSFATNKEDCVRLGPNTGLTAGLGRVHCWGDTDWFSVAIDVSGLGNYGYGAFGGIYAVRPGLATSHTLPLFLLAPTNTSGTILYAGLAAAWGSTAGNSNYEGGVLGRLADGVLPAGAITSFPDLQDALVQPNEQPTAAPELDVLPLGLVVNSVTRYGYVGNIDPVNVGVVFDVDNHQTNVAANVAYAGYSTTASRKYAVPWDGGAAPGGVTREGRQF